MIKKKNTLCSTFSVKRGMDKAINSILCDDLIPLCEILSRSCNYGPGSDHQDIILFALLHVSTIASVPCIICICYLRCAKWQFTSERSTAKFSMLTLNIKQIPLRRLEEAYGYLMPQIVKLYQKTLPLRSFLKDNGNVLFRFV